MGLIILRDIHKGCCDCDGSTRFRKAPGYAGRPDFLLRRMSNLLFDALHYFQLIF